MRRFLEGVLVLAMAAIGARAQGAPAPAPLPPGANVSLDQAIQLALAQSPAMRAARTQIPQSQAEEVTAAIRPNPVLSWDALYLPIFTPGDLTGSYLNNTAELDASLAYTFERGGKRQARIQAARDATAEVRSQVDDNARTLSFNVAQQFIQALLEKSSLDFAQQDLSSWQNTVRIGQDQFQAGSMSQGDLDAIKVQTLQFETTVSGARLGLTQALYSLRQLVGLSTLPADFAVAGDLSFQPIKGNEDDYRSLALLHRPDLIAARQAVTAAQSQYQLARANGKRDLTATAQLTHDNAVVTGGAAFSIEVPVFDRNQGEIARTLSAITQAQDQLQQASDQVMSDVATAYAAAEEGAKVVQLYDSGYRDEAKEVLDIRQYAYQRGAAPLLDLLDAQRTYRQTELAYRQALATYMLAIEQLKEAVGTRNLP